MSENEGEKKKDEKTLKFVEKKILRIIIHTLIFSFVMGNDFIISCSTIS